MSPFMSPLLPPPSPPCPPERETLCGERQVKEEWLAGNGAVVKRQRGQGDFLVVLY